ncbi:MAG TPA: thioredoxin domain-containing protein [Thermoflexia bacterium]|nr:thioredoxin domain-containing protein [Thermoflexia bacterium]
MYGENLRFVYRHFPLVNIHDKAFLAAEGAEAAGAQGAFWEMHDLLFERFEEWRSLPPDRMVDVLTGYAEELGLDTERFAQDLEDHTYQEKVQAQYEDAVGMQLGGTPTFIVNGRLYLRDVSLDAFIRFSMPGQYDAPPPNVIEGERQYLATIRTGKGDITIELYPDQAPVNVNSFVFLARDGWYDGARFYQVLPDNVAVAGNPIGNPGYLCEPEIGELKFDQAGVVGAFGDHFFITLAPQPNLDGRFTIIGRVVSGMEVLQSLAPSDFGDPEAPQGEVIETIVIEEK